MTIETQFRRKTRQIKLACIVWNIADSLFGWVFKVPCWMSSLLYRVTYGPLNRFAHELFSRAYEGSIEEMNDAWEFADEDWLSPFQRLVADERLLPLPLNLRIS